MLDETKGVPLFNAEAWKKANNILQEVLAGHYSDPPGIDFYHQKLDAHGAPATNNLGLALLESWRGTSITECVHKQVEHTFGSWHTGAEMGFALLAVFRHMYTQGVSERRRLGFPRIGHFCTWLIDKIQLLVERNHSVLAYKGWSNESDYERTTEAFSVVPIHSDALGRAVSNISNAKLTGMKLTRNQAFMAKHSGVKVPFLPVHGESEMKLFTQLIASNTSTKLDFEQMALDWVHKVDGVNVFPELPVYLRTYYATWTRNQAAKNAMAKAKPATALLQQVIDKTRHKQSKEQEEGGNGQLAPAAPNQYSEMPQPKVIVVESKEPRIVGGVAISVPLSEAGAGAGAVLDPPPPPLPVPEVKKKAGDRGKDKDQRARRRCMRCVKYNKAANGDAAKLPKCKGAAPTGTCQHWTEGGKALTKK